MGTKVSIKWRQQEANVPGFQLYEDVLDEFADEGETPVYLRLEGVQAEMATQGVGATVTVALPREMARALGLVS